MEKLFNQDRELLITVTDYLANSDYEVIAIFNSMERGKMYILGEGEAEIEDVEVIEAIDALQSHGYKYVEKDDKTIRFQRWSNLDDDRGIAYSIDGSEPTIDYIGDDIGKLEPFSEPNWYYYETDYNEWRIRNNQ